MSNVPDTFPVNWYILTKLVQNVFEAEGKIFPSPQDAATFMAQEAHEVIDLFLREKDYARNNDRSLDTLDKELSQVFMMWIVTCMVAEKDGIKMFLKFYGRSMKDAG